MTNCPARPWSPPVRGNSWRSRGSESSTLRGHSSLLCPWVHLNELPPTEAGPSVCGGWQETSSTDAPITRFASVFPLTVSLIARWTLSSCARDGRLPRCHLQREITVPAFI